MTRRIPQASVIVVALAVAASCSTTTPVQPSSATDVTAAGQPLTASIVAPRPLTPANNAQIANLAQPVTLIVQNAISTKPGITYTFEVATDSAFASKVQTKDGVTEGTSGQTGVKLDALAAAKDYYWHARATGGGTTGVFGIVFKFTIGPAIIINAPVPIAPLTNAQTTPRPVLRVTNATRTGPAGAITYKFEVSTVATFASVLVSGTVSEGVNETGFILTTDLPSTGTLFWHATAIDAANSITSAPSAVQSFTANTPSQAGIVAAQLGVVLWPGVQPPGSTGHAIMGSGWTVEPITSFDGHTFVNPPVDELQIFDLLDRGMSPQAAIDWMHANGYSTFGLWDPNVNVVAFAYQYIALIAGQWDIVRRVGA